MSVNINLIITKLRHRKSYQNFIVINIFWNWIEIDGIDLTVGYLRYIFVSYQPYFAFNFNVPFILPVYRGYNFNRKFAFKFLSCY